MMGILAERRLLEGEWGGDIMEDVKTPVIHDPAKLAAELDPYFEVAQVRAKEAFQRLRDAGILDANGRRIHKDIPPDMQEGKDRDFGG
jgi:hypothetical protein